MVRAADMVDENWLELERRIRCAEATIGGIPAESTIAIPGPAVTTIAARLSESLRRLLAPLSEVSRSTLRALFGDVRALLFARATPSPGTRVVAFNGRFVLIDGTVAAAAATTDAFLHDTTADAAAAAVDARAFAAAAAPVLQRAEQLVALMRETALRAERARSRKPAAEESADFVAARDTYVPSSSSSLPTVDLRARREACLRRAHALMQRVDVLQRDEAAFVASVSARLAEVAHVVKMRSDTDA